MQGLGFCSAARLEIRPQDILKSPFLKPLRAIETRPPELLRNGSKKEPAPRSAEKGCSSYRVSFGVHGNK